MDLSGAQSPNPLCLARYFSVRTLLIPPYFSLTARSDFETSAACKSIEVTVDSNYLFAGCLDGNVIVYNCNGGEKLLTLQKMSKVQHIEFSFGNEFVLIVIKQNAH